MTLKQARRWYEFCVGQLTEDIDGNLALLTIDGKLRLFPMSEYTDSTRSCLGYVCTFWIKKSNGEVKEVAFTGLQERLTEATVEAVWNQNFGEA